MAENTTQRENNTPKKGKNYNFWKPNNYSGRVHARWDSRFTQGFLQACVSQIRKGNRGPKYLNNKGWDGVLETFHNITQVYYDQKQLRNRWDVSKQEYIVWLAVLKGATGLGWNVARGTWDAPEHWWDDMTKKYKFTKRFKDKGLEHTELLEIIFGGRLATGACQWTPGESSEPQQDDTALHIYDDDIGVEEQYNMTSDFNNLSEGPHVASSNERVRERVDEPHVAPSSERGRERFDQPHVASTSDRARERVASTQEKYAPKSKRKRQSSVALLSNTVERMIEAVESQDNEVTVKQYADACNATVELYLEKLNNLPEMIIGSPLYLLGPDLMTTSGNREVFMKFPNDVVRLGWLQSRLEYRNVVMSPSFRFGGGSSFI